MDVSVIICTWNNAERLRSTLTEFTNVEIPNGVDWELVLVNNNCMDDTDSVAHDFRTKLPINYRTEPLQGLSRARNTGIEAASGRLLLFTDDDVFPNTGWLAAYWRAFEQYGCGFYFGGPLTSEFEEPILKSELVRYAPWSVKGLNWGEEARRLETHEKLVSANWACPSEALEEVGLFDVTLGLNASSNGIGVGEESELMNRLQEAGWLPWYLPNAQIRHYVPVEKCAVHHIARRWEAYNFRSAVDSAEKNNARLTSSDVRTALKRLVTYVRARAAARDWHVQYVRYCGSRGKVRGLLSQLRARKS